MTERTKARGRTRNSIDATIEESDKAAVEKKPLEEEHAAAKQTPTPKQKGKAQTKRPRSGHSTPKKSTPHTSIEGEDSVDPTDTKRQAEDVVKEDKESTPMKREEEEEPTHKEQQAEGDAHQKNDHDEEQSAVKKEVQPNGEEKNVQENDHLSDTSVAEEPTQQATKGKKKVSKKKSKSKKKDASAGVGTTQGSKPVYNIAGVNLAALFADGTDAPPLYNRRNRRATRRQRCPLDIDSAVFAQHCDLRSNPAHTERRKVAQLPDAPYSTEEDILSSYTEWRQPPELLYAHLLWRYVPEAFLQLAMQNSKPAEQNR